MKKLALLLCMFGLLSNIYASNASWRYEPGQTKFYALLVSVGKNNDPTQQDRFWAIVENIKLL